MSKLLARKFVLRHKFFEFSEMVENEKRYGPSEIHFDIPWRIKIQRSDSDFAAFFCCQKTEKTENIKVSFQMKLVSILGAEKSRKTSFRIQDLKEGNDGYGWDFMDWKDVENQFMSNGSISVECHVELEEIRKESYRNFDESVREVSDCVLIVDNQKFYVSKLFLSFQSNYFRTLFLGTFLESTKSEVTLKDVDAESFQFFLEVIHGESSITDDNIENLLHLADMYDTPTATRRCEEFLLLFPTKIILRKKIRLAVQYRLGNLKAKCLKEVRTIKDIPDILPVPLKELDIGTAFSMLIRV
ncbi:CRE-BATH-25 protein [Caenorhabditis remanei]|uniref:CRE-BATH-25 protein n=1 Tax=Caenorhabditis remanei TaxID=31234 RepID=E3LM98_CAERE|nr:CRE-BATH-25 protein [Caenorhabditis remanei]